MGQHRSWRSEPRDSSSATQAARCRPYPLNPKPSTPNPFPQLHSGPEGESSASSGDDSSFLERRQKRFQFGNASSALETLAGRYSQVLARWFQKVTLTLTHSLSLTHTPTLSHTLTHSPSLTHTLSLPSPLRGRERERVCVRERE